MLLKLFEWTYIVGGSSHLKCGIKSQGQTYLSANCSNTHPEQDPNLYYLQHNHFLYMQIS